MNRSPSGKASRLLASLSVLFLCSSARAGAEPAPVGLDCGSASLLVLHHVQGLSTDIRAIKRALPKIPDRGYTMLDLQSASSRIGLPLKGVELKKVHGAIDRPMLLFMARKEHGHFLVIRPVGHSGKLVQTIDWMADSDVFDQSELFASPGWTGLALVPSDSRRLHAAQFLLGSSSVLALIVFFFRSSSVLRSGVPVRVTRPT